MADIVETAEATQAVEDSPSETLNAPSETPAVEGTAPDSPEQAAKAEEPEALNSEEAKQPEPEAEAPKTPRREKPNVRAERDALLAEREQIKAELLAEIQRVQAEKAAAEATLAEQRAEQERIAKEALAWLGPDEKYQTLATKAKRAARTGDFLTDDEAAELALWDERREFAALFKSQSERAVQSENERYRAQVNASLAAAFSAVAAKPGVDAETVTKTPDLGAIFDHIYTAGLNSASEDLKDRLAELETENKALKARSLSGARSLETGGESGQFSAALTPERYAAMSFEERTKLRRESPHLIDDMMRRAS